MKTNKIKLTLRDPKFTMNCELYEIDIYLYDNK